MNPASRTLRHDGPSPPEPDEQETIVGALAGLAGGAATWSLVGVAAGLGHAPPLPLRLVAASVLGPAALDPAASGAPLLGALIATVTAVVFGLVFVSVVPDGASVGRATLSGAAFGLLVYLLAWFVLVRVGDPLLYAAGGPYAFQIVALHAAYGAVLGFLVPFLREIAL